MNWTAFQTEFRPNLMHYYSIKTRMRQRMPNEDSTSYGLTKIFFTKKFVKFGSESKLLVFDHAKKVARNFRNSHNKHVRQ